MSTLDAKRVTNTNMDKFINDFDKVLQIESIKSRRDEVLENGTVAIWYTVSFKPFVNNLKSKHILYLLDSLYLLSQ